MRSGHIESRQMLHRRLVSLSRHGGTATGIESRICCGRRDPCSAGLFPWWDMGFDIPSEPTRQSCDRGQRPSTARIVRTLRVPEKRA
jgi:hypothetical protein